MRGGCPNGVIPTQQEEEAASPLRAKVLELEKERDRIEEEIKSHADLMEQLDAEGYPRSDIPIMEVMEARGKMAKLKLDHKEICEKLEKALEEYIAS
ncbi:hypothetical protein GUITHDRAFT_108684 [Guillardia theta CCMP2712]|uniref:Nas2 N-terminal domain-containing protein n=1 Tax=Guillardia theta (strain CCMP2712) TaxID=905079 RepID=L1JAT3_GUITC|nr:hypothetical protein GUITHDRAFT_108684 [Guillardia theta CCMP2712]EKX45417.1 hypothetical protein GUITHDRAFT_108684 [Guillardia theta CCMP2712]|eukprot:XP_005832397.1 hypothetical protein GUITHDRAFT_108684 [Guillardia theta CCMP2712]